MTTEGDEPRPTLEAGEPPLAPPEPMVPGTIEIVSRGLDLNIAASSSIRNLSLYAGGLFVLLLGPVCVIIGLVAARIGGDAIAAYLQELATGGFSTGEIDFGLAPLVLAIGGLGAVAVTVDLQNVAVAVIGAREDGRTLGLRSALAAARRSFWRLIGASILAGLALLVPNLMVDAVLGAERPSAPEGRLILQSTIDVILLAPFAYVGTAVVLGGAGPVGAVRTSWRLASRRWRLAVVVAIVNTATAYLAAFGLGAGADVLARLAAALGIGSSSGPLQVLQLAAIVAFAIAALGSLTVTIAALSVGPQVVAYRGLGGPQEDPGAGLSAGVGAPLLSRGMKITVAILGLLAVTAIVLPG